MRIEIHKKKATCFYDGFDQDVYSGEVWIWNTLLAARYNCNTKKELIKSLIKGSIQQSLLRIKKAINWTTINIFLTIINICITIYMVTLLMAFLNK